MNIEQMQNWSKNNNVFLTGIVQSEPIYSHTTIGGEEYFDITLSVPRLSDQMDKLPISVSAKLLKSGKFEVGKRVSVKGQMRSFNKMVDGKSKLGLTIFVKEICEFEDDMNPNIIEITGYVCKEPTYRTTPFNREICDALIAVNRGYRKSDYLPCIAWGKNAKMVSELKVGSKVAILGRVQSRDYQKHLESGEIVTKTAYEVSINKISLLEEDQTATASDATPVEGA